MSMLFLLFPVFFHDKHPFFPHTKDKLKTIASFLKCLKSVKKGDDSHAKKVTGEINKTMAGFIEKEVDCVIH